MDIWVKNPKTGEKDTMLSLGVFAFIICSFKLVLNGSSIYGVNFGTIDSSLITSMLLPTLGAYVGRRFTDTIDKNKQTSTTEGEEVK